MAFTFEEDLRGIEMKLLDAWFKNSLTTHDRDRMLRNMQECLMVEFEQSFEGLRLDTCANGSSMMSVSQYVPYRNTFGLPMEIDKKTSRSIVGIGGYQNAFGTPTIQIPFTGLKLVIDVEFMIIPATMPMLLSMWNVVNKGLGISIQGQFLSHGRMKQRLKILNYILDHKWRPEDI